MKFAKSSASVLALILATGAAGAEVWHEQSYNPEPTKGDLVLPMPCDGAMAFRQVNVPSGGLLEDHRITLGSHDEEQGYSEYRHAAWLAGSFESGAAAGKRHYFIGKYEVTRMQHTAFDDRCPDPEDADGELPATGLSWSETMLFAERYSEWLVGHAIDRLPAQDGAVGFLRLPTEAEWEFAARGGMAMSPGDFAAKTFVPSGEALDAYVIHDGNSYRELNLIGTRKPNPLGIHDILGNAAELVLAPFRLNVVSHLHGQAGGFVRRGGSYRTRPAKIRSSHREEFPPVDRHGLRREKTTGFRLALVAPVLPSIKSVERTRTAWQALQREPPAKIAKASPRKSGTAQDDPVKEARKLAELATAQMKRRLQALAFRVAETIQARNQERRRAAREALSGTVFAARWVMRDRKGLGRLKVLLGRGATAELRQRIRLKYDNAKRNASINTKHYIDLLTAIAQDYSRREIQEQAEVVEAIYSERGQAILLGLVQTVGQHVEAIRLRGPEVARAGILNSLERRN